MYNFGESGVRQSDVHLNEYLMSRCLFSQLSSPFAAEVLFLFLFLLYLGASWIVFILTLGLCSGAYSSAGVMLKFDRDVHKLSICARQG